MHSHVGFLACVILFSKKKREMLLLIWLTLVQINQANMGIGREYVNKVRDMDADEKQELMKVFDNLLGEKIVLEILV